MEKLLQKMFRFPWLKVPFWDGHFDLDRADQLVGKALEWFSWHLKLAEQNEVKTFYSFKNVFRPKRRRIPRWLRPSTFWAFPSNQNGRKPRRPLPRRGVKVYRPFCWSPFNWPVQIWKNRKRMVKKQKKPQMKKRKNCW